MAGWHEHKNLVCLDCGVVVYPSAKCVMWAGKEYCTLEQTMYCNSCLEKDESRTESFSDTRESTGHNDPEVGLHTALQYLADASQRDLRRAISDVLSSDVSDQTQGVVQEQEDKERAPSGASS